MKHIYIIFSTHDWCPINNKCYPSIKQAQSSGYYNQELHTIQEFIVIKEKAKSSAEIDIHNHNK